MNTQSITDKKNEWTATGKSVMDRAVSEVKSMDSEDIRKTAMELTTKVRDISTEVYDDAIGFVRRNPVGTALGLCAFGFIAGVVTGRIKKA